jgi:hypothetical protein
MGILIPLVLVGAGAYLLYKELSISTCLYLHSPNYANYPWLAHIHKGVKYIQFEEPVESGKWRDYDDHIWDIHCKVVDHTAGNLAKDHIRAFVDPKTRFARLMFHFNDGTIMEPTKEFYELEERYFSRL